MADNYDFKSIEAKWSRKWVLDKTFTPDISNAKSPFYALFMFPYPSAEGLHIGNFYAFTCVDVLSKYKKLCGYDVFEPIGWDAFGIHSENYALQIGETPQKMLSRTTENFRKQLESAGIGCDWTRLVSTTSPEYYKWTQWIFTKLFEKGLAYQKEALLNWCPGCKTVLADEQIDAGVCERCKSVPEKKKMRQWFFKITAYAQRLLDGLGDMDWSEITKAAQKNWIGRSEGAEVKFNIADHDVAITVFTTRPDTLFGATYLVLSPEHELVLQITIAEQKKKVEDYIRKSASKSDLERTENKEKTGVFTGAYAINPVNDEHIPIWISDYVLAGYGTGAIMCVPAHDERDMEFAKKFGVEIRQVVAPFFAGKEKFAIKPNEPMVKSKNNFQWVSAEEMDKRLVFGNQRILWDEYKGIDSAILDDGIAINSDFLNGLKTGEAKDKMIKRLEEKKFGQGVVNYRLRDWCISRQRYWGPPIPIVYCEKCGTVPVPLNPELKIQQTNFYHSYLMGADEITDKDLLGLQIKIVEKVEGNERKLIVPAKNIDQYFQLIEKKLKPGFWNEALGEGRAIFVFKDKKGVCQKFVLNENNEAEIDRLACEFNDENYIGTEKGSVLHWLYNDETGFYKDLFWLTDCLPVKLHELEKNWKPAGDGRGPLAKVKSFMQTVCPKCGGVAEREPDVMDNFLDSAWYYYRYLAVEQNEDLVFATAALLEDTDGQFLFQKRNKKAEHCPGTIGPVGGRIEKDETCLECLKREVFEEIGLNIDVLEKRIVGNFPADAIEGKFVKIYHIKNVDLKNVVLEKGTEILPMSLDEALENKEVTPWTKEIIKHFQKYGSKLDKIFDYQADKMIINNNGVITESLNPQLFTPDKISTLVYLERDDQILLTHKKRGYAKGVWNGPGGKVEIGEDISRAAIREVREEIGVEIKLSDLEDMGVLELTNQGERGEGQKFKIHVFRTKHWSGEPSESEEVQPEWFDKSDLPWKKMWPDDEVWMPEFLAGKKLAWRIWVNDNQVVKKERLVDQTFSIKHPASRTWLPVDLYVGGNEHAVLHLMYTRFITMAFHDLGLVDFDNPFKRFRANGMILKDGAKMSKSKGNVIKPEEYGEKVGYDALKTYLLFLGPLAEDRSFTDSGVQGCKRWVERIVKLESKVGSVQDDESVIKKLHQTIKSVGEDLEDLKYNTAIAKLMELTNTLSSCEKISKPIWEKFLVLIAPFAPAAAEEMWVNLGHKDSIFVGNNWPSYDAKLIVEDKIELVIQINGKVRDKIMVSADITEQEAIRLVKRSEKLKKFLGESDFKKVIFVPGKLINIVV